MTESRSKAATFTVVATTVVVTVSCTYLLASWPPEPLSTAEQPAEADAHPAVAASSPDDEMLLVVLGDSFTATDEGDA